MRTEQYEFDMWLQMPLETLLIASSMSPWTVSSCLFNFFPKYQENLNIALLSFVRKRVFFQEESLLVSLFTFCLYSIRVSYQKERAPCQIFLESLNLFIFIIISIYVFNFKTFGFDSKRNSCNKKHTYLEGIPIFDASFIRSHKVRWILALY